MSSPGVVGGEVGLPLGRVQRAGASHGLVGTPALQTTHHTSYCQLSEEMLDSHAYFADEKTEAQ